MLTEYKDYPVEEVLKNIERLAAEGALCYVKWTCQGCGARCTANEPNTFHKGGYRHEECGYLTIPNGINFLLVWKIGHKEQ